MWLWLSPLTVLAGLKQTLAPFNIGCPPHTFPLTASSCLLDEPISADVVPVGNDHVLLRSWFLFRRTTKFQIRNPQRPTQAQHVPYEPRAAVGEGTVLLPDAEMVSAWGESA